MIALFQIALPYDLLILPGEELQLLQYEGDASIDGIEAFEVLVGPPYRSRLSEDQSGGIVRDPDLFNPADPQPIDPNVEVGGIEPVRCDALAVRIVAANFDRRQQTAAANVRALIVVVCDAVNGLLQRLRVLARATHIKPLTPDTLIYRVVLLDDSGALVEAEDGKWRQLGTASFRIRHAAVTPAIWQELSDLGE